MLSFLYFFILWIIGSFVICSAFLHPTLTSSLLDDHLFIPSFRVLSISVCVLFPLHVHEWVFVLVLPISPPDSWGGIIHAYKLGLNLHKLLYLKSRQGLTHSVCYSSTFYSSVLREFCCLTLLLLYFSLFCNSIWRNWDWDWWCLMRRERGQKPK